MLGEKVKIKKIKGKQNKKKWRKNIDLTEYYEHIQRENNEKRRQQFQKPLIVEDDAEIKKQELDPNRFKNRPKSTPKKKYDNSYKRAEIV